MKTSQDTSNKKDDKFENKVNDENNKDQKDKTILKQHILQLALSNAVEHKGQTEDKKILGKILGARQDLRTSVDAISKIISDIVTQVNAMSEKEQQVQLEKVMSSLSEHLQASQLQTTLSNDNITIQQDKDTPGAWLPPLEHAEYGNVITRFPPEPNGYPHIGHAKAVIINMDYAAKYGGRCILRIDDTNPDAERKEYLAGINVGLEWLGLKFKQKDIVYTSDNMETFYQKGEELIRASRAYVCTCKKDNISKNRRERKECKCCKKDDMDEHYKRWGKMHAAKFKSGEAVMRFRGDMTADNAVMRDPILFRIISTPHYRQDSKYRVWPSYDMSVAIEDSIHGITHAFRSKEFESRAELINALLDALHMRKPQQHYFARLAFDGMPTSKRIIKPLMEDGRILGYDDPRIPTLGGLKRRGIKPKAVRKFIESLGMTKADTTAPFETLESINRNLIDSKSTRLFMIKDAKRIIINDLDGKMTTTQKIIEMSNHPLIQEMGKRKVPVSHDMYIPGVDFEKLEVGSIVKLLGLGYVIIANINTKDNKVSHYYKKRDKSSDDSRRNFAYENNTIYDNEEISAHADFITGTSSMFVAQDVLEFYKRENIDISPEIRAQLESASKLEEEDDIEHNSQNKKDAETTINNNSSKKKRPEIKEDAKMQWVSRDTAVRVKLTIPKRPFDDNGNFDSNSLEETEIYTEPHFNSIEEGAEIQFVRFGYCRKDTGRRVIFTHG